MKNNSTKLIILDLDGTLIDTAADLAYCINLAMIKLDLPSQSLEKVKSLIGNGVHKLVEDILIEALGKEPEDRQITQAYNLFIEFYKENLTTNSCLYPAVFNSLEYFKSINKKLVCITNKLEMFTLPLLKHTKIHKYFDLILSGDSLTKKKPDPFPLEYACRQLDVSTKQSIMVGDSGNDILSARRAGIKSVGMCYGYTEVNELIKHKPDIVLDSFQQLREHVDLESTELHS